MPARSSASDNIDLPEALELAVGEEWRGHLPGLGSAGYAWSADTDVRGIVRVRVAPVAQDDEESSDGLPPDSFSASEEIALVAMRPGEVRIELAQARSWETDQPPHRHHDLTVRVVE